MNMILTSWTAAVESFGVLGTLALLIYAGLVVTAIGTLVVQGVQAWKRWRRQRAVARYLRQVHDEAYREHRGRKEVA